MGKRIACICGKPGRVQHTRMKFLRDNYMPYLDVYADDVPTLNKYEVVYFSHYSLAKKVKFDGKRKYLASVTSHKYDKKELGKFDRISVNNRLLLEELKEFSPVLTENGVDTKFWTPSDRANSRGGIGWVGNVDRYAKRYDIVMCLEDRLPLNWVPLQTSKHDTRQRLEPQNMREYYRSIWVYVVTSDSEGTPNPALEAMSCGVPVLTTPVGNMPDIHSAVKYRNTEQLCMMLGKYHCGHHPNREDIRREMVENWDWSIKYRAWDDFFKEWL